MKQHALLTVVLTGLFLWLSLSCKGHANPLQTPLLKNSLKVGDDTRYYAVYSPPGTVATDVLPMVLVFHGYRGNIVEISHRTEMNQVAEQHRFRVVYPQALQDRWMADAGPDDVGDSDIRFIDALLTQLTQTYATDTKRIYATGFSSGGFFTQRLACDLSDRFAAVATVSATIGVPLSERCKHGQPMPTLTIHGKDDPIVTWDGEIKRIKKAFPVSKILSVQDTHMWLGQRNHCEMTMLASLMHPSPPNWKLHSERIWFPNCPNNNAVDQIVVYGGGHAWPGSPDNFWHRLLVGKATQEFSASQVIWDFFSAHPKP